MTIDRRMMTILIALMLLVSCTAQQPQQVLYEWVQAAGSAQFAPRDGAGALVFDEQMWLIGGWNPRNHPAFPMTTNNEVWSSQNGSTWSLEKANSFLDESFDHGRDWEGRHTAGYAVFQDKMWILGGDVNQGHYQSDVWNSEDGLIWHWVNEGNPVPWGPRVLHHTVVFNDKIWVMGGQTFPSDSDQNDIVFYSDIWTTSDGVNWDQIIPNQPSWSARGMIGGSVVFKDRIWILGGGRYYSDKKREYFNDVWSSSDGMNWTNHTKSAQWVPRSYHDVAMFDGFMWVIGGYDVYNRNDVWFSNDGSHWNELGNTPWRPRHASSVFIFDDSLWVVAGNNMQSDVWRLNRLQDSW
jgi:hypothetical protein